MSFKFTFLLSSIITTQSFNTFTKETGQNGEEIWRSTSPFIPIQPNSSSNPPIDSSYGTIKIGQSMSMEFDFIFGGRTNYPNPNFYENFFRVGFPATSRNCDGEGSRYPSFWLTDGFDDDMHVSVSNGIKCQAGQRLHEYGTIEINVSYHIKIAFNDTATVINVSGGGRDNYTQIHARSPTLSSHIGQEANVWFMSPRFSGDAYNRGNGTFSNIVLISKIFTESPTMNPLTFSPTMHPTLPTTVAPTMSPSLFPTLYPTTEKPTIAPTKVDLESEITDKPETSQTLLDEDRDEDGVEGDGEGKNSKGEIGIFVIIIAVLAVSFCFICGVIILFYRNKEFDEERSKETDGISVRNRMESHLVVSELDNVSIGGHKRKDMASDDEMYLSHAQKKELDATNGANENTLLASYHKFLSEAQRKEIENGGNFTKGEYDYDIEIDDEEMEEESGDTAVGNVETAGYIDNEEGSNSHDVVVEKRMTIGAEDEILGNFKAY